MPKISELPLANKLKEEDYIPIVQDGVTKKVKGTHFVTEEEYSLDAFSPTIAANDKTMYKFGEGDTVDFSDSAYDGAYKSAILKGNTLVNLLADKGEITLNSTHRIEMYDLPYILTKNKKYLLCLNVKSIDTPSGFGNVSTSLYSDDGSTTQLVFSTTEKGYHKSIFTTDDKDYTTQKLWVFVRNGETTQSIVDNIMLLEYQEGMENWDIPYFEGMQSVRMPVLKSVGKNLFDINVYPFVDKVAYSEGNRVVWDGYCGITEFFPVKPNTTYTFTNDLNKPIYFGIVFYDNNKTKLSYGHAERTTFTTPANCAFIRFSIQSDVSPSWVQIEESSQQTSYEPHKSNILSTPQDLVLGGIGDVQDTLDLLTGEVIESTIKGVLDGSEKWGMWIDRGESSNIISFYFDIKNVPNKNNIVINDKFATYDGTTDSHPYYSTSKESIMIAYGTAFGTRFTVGISKDKATNLSEFKSWLSSNNINYIVEADEKVHKTVDLSGTPFGYKGGHIIKSSAEGSLLPKFEYEVAVSRGAQISQNTSTLIKHDEKITELLKKTAATYINQKAEIAYLLNMSSTLEEVQTIPFIEDDYVNDDCMVDSDMVMDNMEVEPEKEIIDNVDTLLINLIYDLIELNDTLGLSEKVELFRQSGLIDKHNYEIIKEKLNPTFKEEDYADINQ